jgi:5-formyltetrahydrofolate cyclo-ligase
VLNEIPHAKGKTALREEMKSRLALLPEEQFREAGLKAAMLIRSSTAWGQFNTTLLFMSLKNEIDTMPLLEACLEDNKKTFLPRVEQKKIRFYRIRQRFYQSKEALVQNQGAYNPWSLGPFGIYEPLPIDPLLDTDFPALVLTPGLAFDRQGNRLGRGRGFYDRFFSELKNLEYLTVGLCMKIQILQSISVDKWDMKVACLFTDLENLDI